MKCLLDAQMARYFAEDIDKIEAEDMRKKILSCRDCRRLNDAFVNIIGHLQVDSVAYYSDAAVSKIMTLVDVERACRKGLSASLKKL